MSKASVSRTVGTLLAAVLLVLVAGRSASFAVGALTTVEECRASCRTAYDACLHSGKDRQVCHADLDACIESCNKP